MCPCNAAQGAGILVGDIEQSAFGPRHEDIDGTLRDEPRERRSTHCELLGREAENNMKIIAHTSEEEVEEVVRRVKCVWLIMLHYRTEIVDNDVELILREQVSDLACR